MVQASLWNEFSVVELFDGDIMRYAFWLNLILSVYYILVIRFVAIPVVTETNRGILN